ncbi:hypothetical protein M413DRAFT_445292 [Hebeloma cylindrosporum]|uniref:Uncharacterized protein n=1 Tax=Hebeloma cylindrosporum TaxID=76867 RepID=A0A0C3CAL3_HEBCY|nr:hypothetical protein M413DRAFT_445292 [Hebeloma cylindrosporum h7]
MKAVEYSDLPSEVGDLIFDQLWYSTSNLPLESVAQKLGLFRKCLPVSRDFRHRILTRSCVTNYVRLIPGNKYTTRLKEVISPPWGSQLDGIGRYITCSYHITPLIRGGHTSSDHL